MSKLKELAKSAYENAKALIDGGTEELMPVFIALQPDDQLEIFGTPFGGDKQKQAVADFLREKFRRDRVKAYVHASEAWMLSYPKDTPKSEMLMPSQSERRIEVVIICGQDLRGNVIAKIAEIERDANNKRSLKPLDEVWDEGTTQGRFATLLNE